MARNRSMRRTSIQSAALAAIVDLLTATSNPLKAGEIETELLDNTDHTRADIRAALKTGVRDKVIRRQTGARNAKLHTLSSPVRRSSPESDRQGEFESASAPIGRGGLTRTNNPPSSPPPSALTKDGPQGTCEICDTPMTIIATGQTRIPVVAA